MVYYVLAKLVISLSPTFLGLTLVLIFLLINQKPIKQAKAIGFLQLVSLVPHGVQLPHTPILIFFTIYIWLYHALREEKSFRSFFSFGYSTALRNLRSALSSVGIDPSGYGEHSGRRGGTTAAPSKGATVNELKIQSRWRSSLCHDSTRTMPFK